MVAVLGMPEDGRADNPTHLKTTGAAAQDAGGSGGGRVGHLDDLQALLAGHHRVDAAIMGVQHLHFVGAVQNIKAALPVPYAAQRDGIVRVGDVHHAGGAPAHSQGIGAAVI